MTQPTPEQLEVARECAKNVYRTLPYSIVSMSYEAASSYAVETALLAIQATEARMAAAVELLRNWMQDGFNSEAEHRQLVEQTEALIRSATDGQE